MIGFIPSKLDINNSLYVGLTDTFASNSAPSKSAARLIVKLTKAFPHHYTLHAPTLGAYVKQRITFNVLLTVFKALTRVYLHAKCQIPIPMHKGMGLSDISFYSCNMS